MASLAASVRALGSALLLAALIPAPIRADDTPPPEPTPGEGEERPEAGGEGEERPEAGDDEPPETPEQAKARKRAARQAKKEGRELDPGSPVAQALDELLHVEHAYAKDGTVVLTYPFSAPQELSDFEVSGFDQAEEVHNARGRRRAQAARPRRLALGVGSQRAGLLLHRLHLGRDWEVSLTLRITRMAPSTDLVLFVGKAGVRFGGELVRRSGSGFRTVERGPDVRDAFDRGRTVSLSLRCNDGALTASVDGEATVATRKLDDEAQGQLGLFATNAHIVIDQITIRGAVDPRKL